MKLFSSVALFACFVFGSLAYGQDPSQPTPPPQKQSDAPKVSVTGCLTKGAAGNEYLVTDQKTGEKLPFAGPVQLDKYLNQTVRLTGTMAAQGQDKVFKPEAINQVAPTCEKGQ
jgi:hypothetical protein